MSSEAASPAAPVPTAHTGICPGSTCPGSTCPGSTCPGSTCPGSTCSGPIRRARLARARSSSTSPCAISPRAISPRSICSCAWPVAQEQFSGLAVLSGHFRHSLRAETRISEEGEPDVAAEQAHAMCLAHHEHATVGFAEQECVVALYPAVRWIRVPQPCHEVRSAPTGVIAATLIALGLERLQSAVGNEHSDTAGAAVAERRFDNGAEVGLAGHVVHGVMDEYRVEGAAKPYRPHVAQVVGALRIERPRHRQHVPGKVDQRHRKGCLEMPGVVTAATAEFQDVADRNRRRVQHGGDVGGLLHVLYRGRDQRPPLGQVLVEAVSHSSALMVWDRVTQTIIQDVLHPHRALRRMAPSTLSRKASTTSSS